MLTRLLQLRFLAHTLLVCVVMAVLIVPGNAWGAANPEINYQGKLTDSSGLAVPDGTYNMRFWLLTSPSIATTSAVWTESLTGVNRVQVTNGLFSVMLGSSSPLVGVDFNQELYLGVEIGSTTTSPVWDGEMSPRKVLGTVPAAFEARRLDGVASSSFLRSDEADTMRATSSNSLLTLVQDGAGAIARFFSGVTEVFTILGNGNVGIGTSTPSHQFTVAGNTRITGALFDGTNASGTSGMVLQATGTTTRWMATSSLGFGSSNVAALDDLTDVTLSGSAAGQILSYNGSQWVNFATSGLAIALSDTTGTLAATRGGTGLSTITQNQLLIGGAGDTWTQIATGSLGLSASFSNSAQLAALLSDETGTGLTVFGTGATLSSTTLSGITYMSGNVGIGTTSPAASLAVAGTAGTNPFVVASSTGTQLLTLTQEGRLGIGSTSPAAFFSVHTPDASANSLATPAFVLRGGRGGDGTAPGRGSLVEMVAGRGGDATSGFSAAANGGAVTIIAGRGGDNTTGGFNLAGTGGDIFLSAGRGGNNNDFYGGNGGNVTITSGAFTGGTIFPTSATPSTLLLTGAGISGGGISLTAGNGNFGGSISLVGGNATSANAGGDVFVDGGVGGGGGGVNGDVLLASARGNVGIGTTSPTAKLTVQGDLRLTGMFVDASSSTGSVGQMLRATATGTQWVSTSTLGLLSTTDIDTSTELAAILTDEMGTSGGFVRANSPTFTGTTIFADATIASATSSNLGLTRLNMGGDSLTDLTGTGLVVSGSALSVATSTLGLGAGFFAQGGNSYAASAILGTNDSNALQFETNNTVAMTIATSGNVGVGTTTPLSRLTVQASSNNPLLSVYADGGAGTALSLHDGTGFDSSQRFFSTQSAFTATAADVGTGGYGQYSELNIDGGTPADFFFSVTGNQNMLTLQNIDGALGAVGVGVQVTALGSTTGSILGMNIGVSGEQRTAAEVMGQRIDLEFDAGSVLGDLFGSRINTGISSVTSAQNVYGISIYGNPTSSTTNYYALHLDGFSSAANDTYGVYQTVEEWQNYFAGSVGIGTTSPTHKLTVQGDLRLTGLLVDASSSTGSVGQILRATATGTQWASTSSLAIALSDTTGTLAATRGGTGLSTITQNQLLIGGAGNTWSQVATGSLGLSASFTNSAALAALLSDETGTGASVFGTGATLSSTTLSGTTYLSGSLGIGTTSPVASLAVTGTAGTNPFVVASSTGTQLLTLTQAGLLGLGSTTPEGQLSMRREGITGTSTVGIDQYIGLANATNAATQFGNRLTMVTTNTATTTIVGSIFRITDSTSYGNTLRGLEVQAQRGINTLGENTAISGFGRTFGVRGTTEGDAGAVFEPAGVYGETRGTTQGNAIRGYSSSITTASLLSLFQDTSAFAGTGLLMNFGNTTGSFSSTTSRFLDFKVAGTSRFFVNASGTVTIGDGTNAAGLQIGRGGLCVDSDGSCTASTSGRISATEYHTGNSDLAEMYFSYQPLRAGEIVSLKSGLSIELANTASRENVIGVVSTQPGLTLGADDASLRAGERAFPIALSGRVPIRLSNENGPIKKGDQIMLSSLPGVGMKATSTGVIVGIALEDFDESRAYSEIFINQFGENLIEPEYPPFVPNDPRISDGCYFGGGGALGETPCVPLQATTSDDQAREAEALAAAEAKRRALAELGATNSETVTLGDNRSVKVGQIVMFVKHDYRYLDEGTTNMLAALMATPTTEPQEGERLVDRIIALAESFVDGVLRIIKLDTQEVQTDKLCVGTTCVDGAALQKLLEQAAGSSVPEEEPAEEPPLVVDDPIPDESSATTTPETPSTGTTSTELLLPDVAVGSAENDASAPPPQEPIFEDNSVEAGAMEDGSPSVEELSAEEEQEGVPAAPDPVLLDTP